MANIITIKQAAQIMGVSELFVRESIAQGKTDIGFCISGKHGKRSFYISPKKFEELTGYKAEGSEDDKAN